MHGCAAVDELMRNTGSLRRLHLYNNMSGDEGAASIARWVAAALSCIALRGERESYELLLQHYCWAGLACCLLPSTPASSPLRAPTDSRPPNAGLPPCPQAAVPLPRHGGL